MTITIEWMNDEGAYIVRQDDQFIGDFPELLAAAEFALAVADNSGDTVELVAIQQE